MLEIKLTEMREVIQGIIENFIMIIEIAHNNLSDELFEDISFHVFNI